MKPFIISPELGFDFEFSSASKVSTIGEFLAEISRIPIVSERNAKLDDCVGRLQAEMKKIEAFKRELPFCMILLNDAIAAIAKIKEELINWKKSNTEPVLEEFMPLKKCSDEKDERMESVKEKDFINNNKDKTNWMSSVQLSDFDYQRNYPKTDFSNNKETLKLDNMKGVDQGTTQQQIKDDFFRSGKNKTDGMGFAPVKGNFPFMMFGKEDKDELTVDPGLSLRTPEIKNLREEIDISNFSSKSSCSRSGSSSATNDQSNLWGGQELKNKRQNVRKQRRCWSADLHRRFVDALQQLGGAQVATPKQIRELMQVDGLSNDEVKSHLQKFRLHSRKNPKTTTPMKEPFILGSLWMSQEQCGESAKKSNSQSGSTQGPLQLNGFNGVDGMENEDDKKSN